MMEYGSYKDWLEGSGILEKYPELEDMTPDEQQNFLEGIGLLRAKGGRIGYALGGNEMLRDSRQGLGGMMMAADDSEMRVPTDMIDDPAGSFETDPMELREEIDREGMLRTAAMEDPMLGYLIQTYDELKDMGQLDPKYMGPQGLEDFIKIEGPMLIQAMQQRDEGAGIA